MIYLDNSATSPIAQEVFEAMRPYLQEEYGNPSSKYYALAAHAADAVENSRSWVAKLIHAKPEEIIFTCGSTESTNMIIKGVADYKKYYEKKGNHIITSKVEHHATLNTCRFLNGDIYSNQDARVVVGRMAFSKEIVQLQHALEQEDDEKDRLRLQQRIEGRYRDRAKLLKKNDQKVQTLQTIFDEIPPSARVLIYGDDLNHLDELGKELDRMGKYYFKYTGEYSLR